MNKKPTGPIQWVGGKGNLRERILPLIPYDTLYVEPFGGAGTILFGREPSEIEIYNDIDGRLVNLFRELQDKDTFEKLKYRLDNTLYSLEEHKLAMQILADKDSSSHDRAWAFFVGQNQGFGGKPSDKSWGRRFTYNSAQGWFNRLSNLEWWHERMKNIAVENRDALVVLDYWNRDDAVIYCDPPYVPAVRKSNSNNFYDSEPDADYHESLVDKFLNCKGSIVVSGYPNEIYKKLEDNGWERKDFDTVIFLTGRTEEVKKNKELETKRIECVWRNKRAVKQCEENSGKNMFGNLFEAKS